MNDYPAEPSMDSAWFAVDRNGLVAVFDTGEAGAIPMQAVTLYDSSSLDDDEIGDGVRRAMVWLWLERHGVEFVGSSDAMGSASAKDGARFVVVFDDPADAAAHVDAGHLEGAGKVWLTRFGISPDVSSQLTTLNSYRGSASFDSWDVVWLDSFLDMFVRYGNDNDGIPGEYDRKHFPARPVRREDIDSVHGRALDSIDVDFSETARLQLADYYDEGECYGSGEAPVRGGDGDADP